MKTLLFLVAGVGIATSNVVWSQDAKPAVDMSALRSACGDDVRKLCPNVEPGGGRSVWFPYCSPRVDCEDRG
jgi:hypothetical protein